ncbi:MAG: hypothetical protein CFE21_00725 [Bacteroidetes bacterium B1(2017)]|nr:MAG: hypothetical protein CFE21_00725 [Bacteroidetes bacterium B1(2017)]
MPNYGGTMLVNGIETQYSFLELSRPTGKYVARAIIRLINILMRKHYVRFIGNSCTPGIVLSNIHSSKGIEQFNNGSNQSCGILIANVLGKEQVPDGIVIPADPFMIIPLQASWKSFADYKAAMSSKYRVRTNRVFALSEQISYRNLNQEGLENWIKPCADLLFETLKHKTITIGKDLTLLLNTFHTQLGNNYQVNGYFKDNKLIGFISFIKEQDQVYAMHLGYEVEIGTEVHLYQRMMYDVIEWSILNHAKMLNLGRTAPEIKSTMGAVPVENSFIFYSRTRFFRFILNYYKKRFHKETPYTLRHPFKGGEK